eukprot:scaffold3962_cov122-Isochrysis_galbana.AAC.9
MGAGLATGLLCPDPGCRLAAAPAEVKALLPAAEYEAYEKSILESSLAGVKRTAGKGGPTHECGNDTRRRTPLAPTRSPLSPLLAPARLLRHIWTRSQAFACHLEPSLRSPGGA